MERLLIPKELDKDRLSQDGKTSAPGEASAGGRRSTGGGALNIQKVPLGCDLEEELPGG